MSFIKFDAQAHLSAFIIARMTMAPAAKMTITIY